MGVVVALSMTLVSDWLVVALYGDAYSPAADVLALHTWTGVFVFLGVASGKYLTVENFTRQYFYRTVFGATVNVGLNFLLIPSYGISGAAVATLVGQIAANYLYDIVDPDLHHQMKMKTKSFFPVHLLRR